MTRRLVPTLISAVIGLTLFTAGAASATTAPFKVKACWLKEWHRFEGESKKHKEKEKIRNFIIDGSAGSPIIWQIPDGRLSLLFAAQLHNARKAKLIEDALNDPTTIANALANYGITDTFTINSYRIKGNRTVNKSFKKAKDLFNLKVNLTFDSGPNLGLSMDFGAKATCQGKRVSP